MRAAARFMASQSWCGQSVVRALRPAPERTHDFEIWPRISRNPSNPKPVTLEMCGVSVRLWCEARLSGAGHAGAGLRSGLGSRLRPLGSRLWIEDTSRASGRCGGYNSSNTHTTQGGVGHNNIASSTSQQINLTKSTPAGTRRPRTGSERQGQCRARGGKDAKHGEEPRTRRAHRSNIMLHACTRTTDALPSCTHAPDPLPNHGLAVGVHLHLRCPSTGLKPNVSSATCPSVCRICLPVLMPYATTDPCAIRLRRLLGA